MSHQKRAMVFNPAFGGRWSPSEPDPSQTTAKPQVATKRVRRSGTESPASTYSRHEQIGEGLWELEQVFSDPGCFGGMTTREATETLASEFIGKWRDDEILGRLDKFIVAEEAGRLREAFRHLGFVKRKLRTRWGITPLPSQPIDESDRREYRAWSGGSR